MPKKAPHISLPSEFLLKRVLGISAGEFSTWPESVRELASTLAEELFLIRYNPFIPAHMVWKSVNDRLEAEAPSLSGEYFEPISVKLNTFWREHQDDMAFRKVLVDRLVGFMPKECVKTEPHTLVECATDATDLRMELPLMVLFPETTEQIRSIVLLANELEFSIVPRGGGSGLTGGAVPGQRRSAVLSLSRLKKITRIDRENLVLCAQSGVITLNAIQAAAREDLLLTVDPASKAASSLGGNISENAGGPFAFEYGTTLDNLLSYTMVRPTGEVIEIRRKDHPRHKILPDENVVFEILAENGQVIETLAMSGDDFRTPGLGKDVTNKVLGGLPGVQKEGLDGIITEACFTLHPRPSHSRTLCLEFFGRSMHNAMLVIKDVVGLRDTIRRQGDLVKISALEEFGSKYVQAIEYRKKSSLYEGEPISVLLLQLDSNDEPALDQAVRAIVDIAGPYDKVDIFVARDEKEAEYFWEDRHKLSAISKRTSGFKINEDVVIPLGVIPEFSDFIEGLNLFYLAQAYRTALEGVSKLPGVQVGDEFIQMELEVTTDILKGVLTTDELAEQEFAVQIHYFFQDLRNRYPKIAEELKSILDRLSSTRIIVANHMHAGDGNCHVNIPVNSNDPEMLRLAEQAAEKVFEKVMALNGQVSGEHGIGITKIAFLSQEKIDAIREYKRKIDPKNILNPGKLVKRDLPVKPYTFSFNQLIGDIDKSGLPGKETLVRLLTNIQTCTRCGKCKQVCPMYYPEQGLMFHPRNKNITFGALIEAIYYSQILLKRPDPFLLDQLRKIVEHCTACGKCTAICPVKINSPEVALGLRSFLDTKQAGGHPVKNRILSFLIKDPGRRIPQAAKVAALGQRIQNRTIGLIPAAWRERMQHPVLRGPGPDLGLNNLSEGLRLSKGAIFATRTDGRTSREAVLYFPGCGGSLFYRTIGEASVLLLLKSGTSVILPPRHLCCGYPLLSAGCEEAYTRNKKTTVQTLADLVSKAEEQGLSVGTVLTSCGTCRGALEGFDLAKRLGRTLIHKDVVQFLFEHLPGPDKGAASDLLYHQSCHIEWSSIPPLKAADIYAKALADHAGTRVRISPGCCGESGMGALTSPAIYNAIRKRKRDLLREELSGFAGPVVVGCPSCKVGITRTMKEMRTANPVLHTTEYLAELHFGPDWERIITRAAERAETRNSIRVLSL
jgi:FAD/FMN-containing dehydrogenase/Fe-S oxidoreductase